MAIKEAADLSVSQTKTIQKPATSSGGTIAEKYKIIEEIGRGGMGVVYKAKDIRLDRTVALKFLSSELTQNEEAKQRFVQEAKAAAALNHPHICTIYEVDDTDGQTFISMEYIEGQTLKERLASGPLSFGEATDIAIQVSQGLEKAHDKGIVHRDIKPANIILGAMLYKMLSGRLPFVGDREESTLYSVVHEEPQPLKALKPDIPQKLLHVVGRALSKRPIDRYQSAAELLNELEKHQELLKVHDAGISVFSSLFQFIRRPMVAIPSLLLVAAICLVLAWFLTHQAKIRWARNTAVPEIVNLISQDDLNAAYTLAEQVEKYIPADPTLESLWPQISTSVTAETLPPEAAM
jgi:serine/threonine protein kinase